ncbi:hypothetical protein [Streptomyces niveus]|uniref:hypothetical protein n=1 Tax=Streptomyces niveus TaxID=193462 RepID=UPI00378B14A4
MPNAHAAGGGGEVARTMRDSMDAIRLDFAEANQWVFYGMAIALGLASICSLFHPGTRVTSTRARQDPNDRP